jgi:predicted nucleotidyltransferase
MNYRHAFALALQLSADALKSATSRSDAKQRIERLARDAEAGKIQADKTYLRQLVKMLANLSPDVDEVQFLSEKAADLQRRASAFGAYAKVRRLE